MLNNYIAEISNPSSSKASVLESMSLKHKDELNAEAEAET
jgi:hypothetical protein